MELARTLEKAKKASEEKKYFSPLWPAYAYERAGDNEQAMKWLETAYAEHSPRLVRLRMERDLVGLHEDARFEELVRRVGLRESN